jgi:hypothetical protein
MLPLPVCMLLIQSKIRRESMLFCDTQDACLAVNDSPAR